MPARCHIRAGSHHPDPVRWRRYPAAGYRPARLEIAPAKAEGKACAEMARLRLLDHQRRRVWLSAGCCPVAARRCDEQGAERFLPHRVGNRRLVRQPWVWFRHPGTWT